MSYTRSGGSPPDSAISRIGTRTPAAPSTNTLRELGNDVEKSDMRHSLRRFSSYSMREMSGRRALVGLLAAAAAVNVAVALWDLIAGGFHVELLGLRISSWEVYKPLRNALLCAVPAVWFHDRIAQPGRTSWELLQRRAGVVVALLVAGWTGMAAAYAARAVGGSDTYGYVSEARLWAAGRLTVHDRLAELAPMIGPSVAPLGYQLARVPGAIVPTYSPGLPLLMAAALKVTGREGSVYAIVPLLGAIGIWVMYVLGRRTAGPAAGLFAALAIALSPIYNFQALHPMSDVPVTTWWLIAWALCWTPGRLAAAGASAAIALAVLTRPNLAPLALFIVAAMVIERPRLVRAVLVAAGAAAGAAAIAALNSHLYGSPTTSGYGSLESLYSWKNAAANLQNYVGWLVELHSPIPLLAFAAPFVAASPRTWLMAAFVFGVLFSYLFYFVYDNWTYLRFMLPAVPVLLVLTGAVLAALVDRLPRSVRGIAAVAIALVPCWYEPQASPFDVSNVARGQQRYAIVGETIDRRLPENAVVLSVVDSGSIRMYGHRETLRWELIRGDRLDYTFGVLKAHGYEPFIMTEDFEEPPFRERFAGGSDAGRLDWPARIEFFGGWRAKVYAVDDRARYAAGQDVPRIVVPQR